MARPERNDVDYFPFYCKEGKTTFFIEEKYKNDGFASWVKILRALAKTDYHFLNLSDQSELMYLSAKCKISDELLIKILDDLAILGEIDLPLWRESKIVYSQKFMDSIADAYKKRNNNFLLRGELIQRLVSLRILLPTSEPENLPVNPQSIVKESKVNNTKGKESKQEPQIKIIEMPYSSEAFALKWKEWIEYRSEIKKPYKSEKSINALLKKLKNYSENFSIMLINRSMENQWQGLIFEKTDLEFKNYKHDATPKIITPGNGFGKL